MKKVIVIGFDGLDPRIAAALLDARALPNLGRLMQQGGFSPVRTTYPPQTPVAWSTFATGTNPGAHGIFDFVRRDPATYLPDLSLNRYERRNKYVPPRAVNLRRGTPVWELLSSAGMPSVILRCPCTFPPDAFRGRMLAGMGVPDLRGGLGTSTFYTARDGVTPQESEHVVRVRVDANGVIDSHVIGPRDPRSGADLRFPITLHPRPAARQVAVQSEGQPKLLEVRERQWSDWLKAKFRTGLLQSVGGVLRFYLVRLEPVFELYASPVNFDPDAPLFPISSPPEYARELARRLGTFYTTGMVEDHGGLNNGRFGETAYLEQCEAVLREREKMLLYELDRLDEGLLFCLFDTPDRIQHMFWRFREPGHPAGQDDESGKGAAVIDEHYRACDAVIGRVLESADDETLVVVLSDHGMTSFQRGVHLNTWLHDQGLLALRNGVKPGAEAGDLFRNVDWSRTRAYALGLGGIYLNLKGREGEGIVEAGEAAALKAAIIEGLGALADPARDRLAIRRVVTREQVYAGAYTDEAPDLLVNFAEGYRVSWATALGGIPARHFEDNVKKWSGDHLVDPCLVPGVLFMNRPFRGEAAGLADLAPTILAALGVPKSSAMEGRSLLA